MQRKVVFVTGCTSGIGLAIGKYLLEKGCIVYGTSRTLDDETLQGIHIYRMVLEDTASIQKAVNQVIEKEGRIDVLINNAGYGMAGSLEDTSLEELTKVFHANVFGLIECCKAVIPHMRKEKSGKIINISSIAGEFGLPFRGVYSASKSAVDRLSETFRMELRPWNIHVSIIQPGDFKTNINKNRIVAKKGLDEDSPYYKIFKREYEQISAEVTKAKDPVLVARAAWKIIRSKKPKMRYPVATFVQRTSISVNRILPSHLFQKILMRIYPIE